jgi:SAM-dependent methyltransferase
MSHPFDEYYFANCCGRPYGRNEHWLGFFGRIADRIVRDIAPGRVLDAGCAMGLLVEALRERGVEAWGIDVSPYAISQVHDSVKAYCREGSITDPFDGRYDLITCIEVVEHMPPADAEAAVANLCGHADDVLFSSSSTDYREPTHVNVQPPEHWAELFARHGFYRDVDFDASFVANWAVRYRRSADVLPRIVRGFERRLARDQHERADARAFAAEAQHKQATAEARLADAREVLVREIESLRTTVSALDADLQTLRRDRTALEAAVAASGSRAEAADIRARAAEARAGAADAAAGTAAARASAAEAGANAAEADARAAELRADVAEAHAVAAELRAEAAETRARAAEEEAAAVEARARAAEASAEAATQTIRNMESSVFWKLRKLLRRT